MSFDAFISYSSQDVSIANATCAALEAASIRCWIAPRDILPDEPPKTAIGRAMDQCRVVVLIFSSNANDSVTVHREVDLAFGKGISVIPLRIDNVILADGLAYYLNTVHWLNATKPPLEEHLDELVKTVRAVVKAGEAPPSREAEAARLRADEEQAFTTAKVEDTVAAVDAFLAAHSKSHLVAAAKALRTMLIARDEAYGATTGQHDPAVLKAFLDRYPVGKPANEVSQRLQHLEAAQSRRPSRRTMLITGGVLGAGTLAAAVVIKRIVGTGPIRTFVGHTDKVYSVAFTPDGRNVLSGSWDTTLKLWDSNSGSLLRTFTGHTTAVEAVAISPDGLSALSGSPKEVKLWNLASGSTTRTFNATKPVAIGPDGHTALLGSDDGSIKLWNLSTGSIVRTFDAGDPSSIVFAPDGRTALSGNSEGVMRLWDLAKGALVRSFIHVGSLDAVTFSPDGRTGISAGGSTMKLWDIASGNNLHTFPTHNIFGDPNYFTSVAITPDSLSALSGGYRNLTLWTIADVGAIRNFSGHTDIVNSVAIASDGRTAVSGSADKTVKLWDLT